MWYQSDQCSKLSKCFLRCKDPPKSLRRKLASTSPEACSYFLGGGPRAEKSVCTPQVTGMDGEYRKRFDAIGKTLSKRMFNEKLTLN